MPTPDPVSRTNFLLPQPSPKVPVFIGEQRLKAQALLSSAISEHQLMTILQLINKDPSLALGSVPMKMVAGGVARIEETDFATACLLNDIPAGYVFAINNGYSVDTLDATGHSLLDLAVTKIQAGTAITHVGLLLSMGANPGVGAEPSETLAGLFSSAMQQAYPSAKGQSLKSNLPSRRIQGEGVISMLLSAKANPVYPPNFKCPISILVSSEGWSQPDHAADLTMMMVRLVKAGCSPDRHTGSPLMSPVQLAIGSRNGDALVTLVRVGAKTSSEALKGKDLFGLMETHGLSEFKPAVQSALMEQTIARAVGSVSTSLTNANDENKFSSRRRMSAI